MKFITGILIMHAVIAISILSGCAEPNAEEYTKYTPSLPLLTALQMKRTIVYDPGGFQTPIYRYENSEVVCYFAGNSRGKTLQCKFKK